MLQNLLDAMGAAVKAIDVHGGRDLVLVHHNDTDGLSSGAVTMTAFERCGFKVSRFSLEKPYPQVLERIFAESGRIVVFADFAGRIAPLIAAMNRGRNLVVILDHHPALPSNDPSVLNLDGELFGLKGDRDLSASATCYLFAETLLKSRGLEAEDLAQLGALGAIGDGFFVDGALAGVNREVAAKAMRAGLMRAEAREGGEDYSIRIGARFYEAERLCTALDTAGGVGYYDGGPERGIRICLEGLDAEAEGYVNGLQATRDRIFNEEIAGLKDRLIDTPRLQWFDLEGRFRPMGIKMVGVFCTMIKDSPLLDGGKYLAGFQRIPDEVPGFGAIAFGSTKISMRVSKGLTERIRAGRMPGLDSFLPQATEELGGFVDACHGLSAATTVKIGQERELIERVEKVLLERMASDG